MSTRNTIRDVFAFLSTPGRGRQSPGRAAGTAPIYAGQPGQAPHLDRDGDGVGCE